ncbi:3-hydroxybutyryl-CoA dehydrogenase [Saccharomonospora viridis]|jgi:3-hydroxybutyryl-CoA dehydrogenase|uniref:3-hydroxyacyl-CoA dehydrogenase n=2 Tax=Saccharomonospora viridis TaxID=1852 RepID=C7MW86_SACVD|nr:3-hydroxybutyryl-CoA dehydrogenase [Saccharomonospora viridis]ACU97855.1 3-hydroxyacyl-CoA dehydrogenase [Saccharomonospora viridis DSM 43017]KHF45819.1 3-hydroxybutyryl-CoA dehydrogenase [Saccharomonospora viridis]SFP42060.1 3-hydroxybutyryl-CoA dehydrogenase [Saccharomonospora viridis]
MGDITRIGVIGAGLMGSGIAEVAARAGRDVVVVEANAAAADAGRERIEKSLARGVEKGKLSAEDRDAALGRLTFTTDMEACSDRELVVEAIAENEALKLEVFGKLDRIVQSKDAILASNTSSLPIMRLAMATQRPEYVVGLHFFNPVPVQKLVELIPSLLTGEETAKRAEAFASEVLGKTVIKAPDRAGFVVNALLVPYLLSAIRMVEAGHATPEDIDNGMVLGCAHPMGPLRLTDLVGLDTTMAVAESMYAEYKEPLYAPPPLLRRMVEAGLYGKKSGRGFYDYTRGE